MHAKVYVHDCLYLNLTSIEQYFNCFWDIAFKFVVLSLNIEMNVIPSQAVDESFITSVHM